MRSPVLGHRHRRDMINVSVVSRLLDPLSGCQGPVSMLGRGRNKAESHSQEVVYLLLVGLLISQAFKWEEILESIQSSILISKWGHSSPAGAGDLSKVPQRIESNVSNVLPAPVPHAPSIGSTLPQSLLLAVGAQNIMRQLRPKGEASQEEYISSLCEIHDKVRPIYCADLTHIFIDLLKLIVPGDSFQYWELKNIRQESNDGCRFPILLVK